MKLIILTLLLTSQVSSQQIRQQYMKHITPVDYEVPHEVIFGDEQCWTEAEGPLIVPANCTGNLNYCSKCFFDKDVRDYRNQYVSYTDNRLIVGTLDKLYAFDVRHIEFEVVEEVDTSPMTIDSNSRNSCLNNGYKQEACRNFNRVLLALPEGGQILTCGTNAYNADNACQIREIKNLAKSHGIKGEGFVPINEKALNTALFSDRRVFSGTMMSDSPLNNLFAITSAKIETEPGVGLSFRGIVTTTRNADWLDRAKFVGSFSSGDYAYFLFQEIEYHFLSQSQTKVVSRIARVCKSDGGAAIDDNILGSVHLWRSFVKAKIYCENKVTDATFGEQVFTYNRISDGVLDDKRILYASFSEGDTSASGSVVCRFNLTNIDNVFNSAKYWNTRLNVAQDRTQPTCRLVDSVKSRDIYELRLARDDVKSKEPPLFLQSGPQFTKILIDSNVQNSSNPVIFIGTNLGKVLKVTWTTKSEGVLQPVLIESLQVSKGTINSDLSVYFLAFEKPQDPNYLFVGTGTSVSKVVISRCLRLQNLSQNCCYASRDPYCGWCSALNKCTSRQDCSSDWIQSLTEAAKPDFTSTCKRMQDNTPAPTTPLPQTTPPPNQETVHHGKTPTKDPTTPVPARPETVPPVLSTTEPPTENVTEQKVVTEPARPNVTYVVTPSAAKDSSLGPDGEAVTSETDSWKMVAIVMATLCCIFVVISALLALNLFRKWIYAKKKQPQKMGNHNMQHSYNPLSTTNNSKTDDFSDRIPVYNTRTNNV